MDPGEAGEARGDDARRVVDPADGVAITAQNVTGPDMGVDVDPGDPYAFTLVNAFALAGTGGALKWIDNFGILILIFVMLGWGLNIVVGLAGDGDSNAIGTLRAVANTMQRYGLTVNPNDLKAKNVAAVLGLPAVRYAGDPDREVLRVAVLPGSGQRVGQAAAEQSPAG